MQNNFVPLSKGTEELDDNARIYIQAAKILSIMGVYGDDPDKVSMLCEEDVGFEDLIEYTEYASGPAEIVSPGTSLILYTVGYIKILSDVVDGLNVVYVHTVNVVTLLSWVEHWRHHKSEIDEEDQQALSSSLHDMLQRESELYRSCDADGKGAVVTKMMSEFYKGLNFLLNK